jgi:hypothetical protein
VTIGFQTHAQAAASTILENGEGYLIGGQAVLNDAGAGLWKYDAASSAPAGVDVIVVTAGGRLLRMTTPASAYAELIATAIAGKRLSVEPLATLGLAAVVAAASNTATITLPSASRGWRLTAQTADVVFRMGASGVIAIAAADHYLPVGQSIEVKVLTGVTHVAAIRAGSTDGSLRISALNT